MSNDEWKRLLQLLRQVFQRVSMIFPLQTATVDGITTSVADISGLAVNAFYTVSVVANTFSTGMGTTEDTISVKTLSPAGM